MRKLFRYALRFLVIVAVVASVSLTIAPSQGAKSPYLSALSDLANVPALAAPCPNEGCVLVGGVVACNFKKHYQCGGVPGATHCLFPGGRPC